jgi:tetratricopeptide (TPR) repeat protein
VKLIQRMKIWKELRRLEAKAKEALSPSTYVDLGQVYINMDMIDHAQRVADEGLALFPQSDALKKLKKFAKKTQLNKGIKELRVRLNKGPSPGLYKEMADLYLELGDFGAVHGAAEECIRRFPDDARAYLVLAKARLTNFYRDISARDGIEAVRGLEKVVELDPENVKAHKLLAEVLYRVGSVNLAVKHLRIALELAPGDREAETLMRETETRKNVEGTLEELFHKVETNRNLTHAQTTQSRTKQPFVSEDAIGPIRDSLAQLVELDGVIKACYIKGSKAMVKGEIKDGKDVFMRVVRVVTKAARRVCRRMDVGTFSKGCIDGDFGHICLCSFGEVVAAVLCEHGTPVDRILADLQELVAGSLYMSGRS